MNSIGTLFIDCPMQEKQGAFTAGREISEDEYVKMLRDYSATIGTGMPRSGADNRHGVYTIHQGQNEEEKNMSKSSVQIYDISGKPCDIRELYRIQKNGMGVIIIELLENEMEDSFESEFKFWKRDSMNINNDAQISKNERIRFLPEKDLEFEIDGHVFLFLGCKMYCEYDRLKVALIIQRITEI
jgi:hypothetical protein